MNDQISDHRQIRRPMRRLLDALARIIEAAREAEAARDELHSAAVRPELRVVPRSRGPEERSTPKELGGTTAEGGVE
jgi:hypothetical protein